nr:monoglyceride lipase-like [Rhipicephalus microplus]
MATFPLLQGSSALLFITHGYGDYSHDDGYVILAKALAPRGFYVFTHDHVGHGRSEGPRATVRTFDIYVDDILTHVDMERAKFPGKPVFLFGHSMGGLLVILVALRRPGGFAGMVVMSPLLGIEHPYYTRFTKAQARASAVELPFLLQHGTGDVVCYPEASKQFFEKAASRDKSLKLYNGAYHTLLEEPDGVAQEALKDVLDWLTARLPPLKSASTSAPNQQPGTPGQADSAKETFQATAPEH